MLPLQERDELIEVFDAFFDLRELGMGADDDEDESEHDKSGGNVDEDVSEQDKADYNIYEDDFETESGRNSGSDFEPRYPLASGKSIWGPKRRVYVVKSNDSWSTFEAGKEDGNEATRGDHEQSKLRPEDQDDKDECNSSGDEHLVGHDSTIAENIPIITETM